MWAVHSREWFVYFHTGCISLTLWLLYQFMDRMSAKYAWAWQTRDFWGTAGTLWLIEWGLRDTDIVDSTCDMNAKMKVLTMLNIFAERGKKNLYLFCLILKMFLQIFVVCFRVYPWLINEYAVMVLSYAAIRGEYKNWFVPFGRLIKNKHLGHFHVELFHAEMRCKLSELPFHPSLSGKQSEPDIW